MNILRKNRKLKNTIQDDRWAMYDIKRKVAKAESRTLGKLAQMRAKAGVGGSPTIRARKTFAFKRKRYQSAKIPSKKPIGEKTISSKEYFVVSI